MRKPNVVVVGTSFGARVHVPALRAAGFHVVALVGTDLARTEGRAAKIGVDWATTDLVSVLDAVEAVTIATPPASHRMLALTAIRAGKHVICEKPFTLRATAAAELATAAERARVTALVGHEFRWAPDRAVLGKAIADGRIGEPRIATFVQYVPFVADPAVRMPSWWFDREAGGGWLGASGSHMIDQVRVWLGEFSSVSASLRVVSQREVSADDSFSVRARLANGCDVVVQQTSGAFGPMSGMTRVAGSRGTVWLEGGHTWLADATGTQELEIPPSLQLPEVPARSDDPMHAYTHLELGPYTRLCEALRAGVEGRAHASAVPVPTFADAVFDMRVLDAIRASAAASGARVGV